MIDGQPRSAHVIALQPSTVGVIPQKAAREVFYKLPATAEAMMKHLASLVRNLSTFRALLAIPNAQQRVYAIDVNLITRPGPRIVDGIEALAKDLYPSLFS